MTLLPGPTLPHARASAQPLEAAARVAFRRLVPFLLICFIVAWIDRVNVGFAALHMNRDLGFSATVYGFGAGVFFLGYALCEIPSNLILCRVGARRWFARIMITWGALASSMALVHGQALFYGLRFLLGAAEAGFLPGVLFYLGAWFPAAYRARAIAAFMAAIPLSSIVGGPLAGLLLALDHRFGLAGWQWLFFLEGLPAVALGLVAVWYLPDSPAQASWLSPEQQSLLIDSVGRDDSANHSCELSLKGAVTHPTVWRLGLIYFLGSTGSYGLTLWLPEILKGLSGSPDFVVGLLSSIPYLAAAVGTLLIGAHSDRTGERRLHAAVPCLAAAGGFLAAAVLTSTPLALGSVALAATGIYGRNGPFWAMPRHFLSGKAAAGGLALINTVGALGGFLGPYAIGLIKDTTGLFRGGLLLLAVALTAAGLLTLTLRPSSLKPVLGRAS